MKNKGEQKEQMPGMRASRRSKGKEDQVRKEYGFNNREVENQNKFQVLQEEEDENGGERKEQDDNENEPMEIIKETKEHGITQNREAEEEMGEI